MKNNKAFTLIELLAVIIILGILLIIAIPSVTRYISDSRNSAYINTAKQVIGSARNLVNSGKLEMYDQSITYYIPNSCIRIENGGIAESPYGKFTKAYVVVTYNGKGFDYYWTSVDESGHGIKNIVSYDNLKEDDIETDLKDDDIKEKRLVGNTKKYRVYDNTCSTHNDFEVTEASSILTDTVITEADGFEIREYTGSHIDSPGGSGNKDIYYFYTDNADGGYNIKKKNNVLFAGYCWQMIRTTDTGGLKVLYAGPYRNGKCPTSDSQMKIDYGVYNDNSDSPSYLGYMYNEVYAHKNIDITTGDFVYGRSFIYENGKYKLQQTNTRLTDYNKYACFSTNTDECETLAFVFLKQSNTAYYIELTNGKSIDDALNDMLWADNVNTKDSTVKRQIDTWYETHLSNYSNYLEDVVFCNDRTLKSYSGWKMNGWFNDYSGSMKFKNKDSLTDLSCPNETDRFSVSNSKAKLKYPIGLPTKSELNLSGHIKSRNNGSWFLTMTPVEFDIGAHIGEVSWDGALETHYTSTTFSVRPVISLSPNVEFDGGDGSISNPYKVK